MVRPLRKKKVSLAPVFERLAPDVPTKTVVAVDLIPDPMGYRESPVKLPALRRNGSLAITGDGEWLVTEPPKLAVLRETRLDPLGKMRAQGNIDEARFLAGRRWQALYERSELGSVQAVDTTREPVDGGAMPEVLTDGQRVAILGLIQAEAALMASVPERIRGIIRVTVIRDVLGSGLSLAVVAAMRGLGAESRKGLGSEFRAALLVLAEQFGYAQAEAHQQIKKLAIGGRFIPIDSYNPSLDRNVSKGRATNRRWNCQVPRRRPAG